MKPCITMCSRYVPAWICFVGIAMVFIHAASYHESSFEREDTLSAYHFFTGSLAALDPAPGVLPYDLNTPLFSNYAEKLRFVKLPEGGKATYNDTSVFDFPLGTVFIKNFYYPDDFRKPEKGRRILETRLLVHEASGWNAYPYIWNEAQTEAFYDPAGETMELKYTDQNGKKVTTPYVVPNKNQCKGCHIRAQALMPIGPAARHLNRDYHYTTGTKNQLAYWKEAGIITGIPDDLTKAPRLARWNDPASGDVNDRARAYLDINCGHCHNRQGPAGTSGLFLDIYEKDRSRFGVNKPPVAAGRGAGNLAYDITPGHPQSSILVFRMKTNDPAIAMPEIGREQVHKEGVALIEEWIRKLPAQ